MALVAPLLSRRRRTPRKTYGLTTDFPYKGPRDPVTHNMTSPTEAPETSTAEDGRFGTIETRDGETIIYDRETPEAWVQSDYLVECES